MNIFLAQAGTLWTATAHIITLVIGAGVLSLPWSVAQLGWIAGPAVMICFALITYYSSILLADCYRFPDPVSGPHRNYTYRDAVKAILGFQSCHTLNLIFGCIYIWVVFIISGIIDFFYFYFWFFLVGDRKAWLCGLIQYLGLCGTCIAYTLTASISMRAIRQSDCYHKNGHEYQCQYSAYPFLIIFGITQVILSQIPSFHKLSGLSTIAAIMSISYSTIGLGLGIAKVVENGKVYGNIGGINMPASQKVWKVLQAVGDIAFSYPFSVLLIEIENTLKPQPPENKTIKKSSMIAVVTTNFFYMLCGCFGYAAFGDNAPGNILTGFGFYEPYWLIDFANMCIVVHLVGAYQVFCQPLFAFIEDWLLNKWPNHRTINYECGLPIPLLGLYNVKLFRLCWRTAFVISMTGIAILFPLFNQFIGLAASAKFWPLVVYFPVSMHIEQNKVQHWTVDWILLQAFSFICLLISVASTVASIEGLVKGQ